MSVLEIDLVGSRDAVRSLDAAASLLATASVALADGTVRSTVGADAEVLAGWCGDTGRDVDRTARLLSLVVDRVEHADRLPPDHDRWIERLTAEVTDATSDRPPAPVHRVEGPWGVGPPNPGGSAGHFDERFLEVNDAVGVAIPAGTDVAAVATVLDQLQVRQQDHGHQGNVSNRLANELFAEAVRRGDLVLNDDGWYEAQGCDGQCWPSQGGATASRVILGFVNQAEAEAIAEGSLDMLGITTGVFSTAIAANLLKKIRPGAEAELPTRVVTTEPITYGGARPSTASTADVSPQVVVNRSQISTRISRQRQERHIFGDPKRGAKSYFHSVEDAQRVLDDFHSGGADILGFKGDYIVIRSDAAIGFNHNVGTGHLDQQTDVFFVKGSRSPSVVPHNPNWTP